MMKFATVDAKDDCMEGLPWVDVTCVRSEADQSCWIACQQRHGYDAKAWCRYVLPVEMMKFPTVDAKDDCIEGLPWADIVTMLDRVSAASWTRGQGLVPVYRSSLAYASLLLQLGLLKY
ncbi:hypothetical protein Pfo_006329 [Paulownia fortunei]|nr:hypothetical protein Pfo_006329 [Paulownia fortunei]